jgi:hypothetical protein
LRKKIALGFEFEERSLQNQFFTAVASLMHNLGILEVTMPSREETPMVRRSWKLFSLVLLLWAWLLPQGALAQELTPLSISLEGYPYPYPVALFDLHQEGQDLRMAYMDVKPEGQGTGKTLAVLHGKNFPVSY